MNLPLPVNTPNTALSPLLRVESEHARQWYMNEAATLNWPTRTLMPTAVLPGFVAN